MIYPLYDPPTWNGVPANWATTQGHPVPENLAYSNTAMQSMGSDGFALGDLNWYPSQLAQWHPTAVQPNTRTVPERYTLSQNYPNPFNPSTVVTYSVPERIRVTIEVFNILGQKIATLFDQEQDPGVHSISWVAQNSDGQVLGSGVYFLRMQAGTFSQVEKMIFMK